MYEKVLRIFETVTFTKRLGQVGKGREGYEKCREIREQDLNRLEKYRERYGRVGKCMTNVGTGMRNVRTCTEIYENKWKGKKRFRQFTKR